MFNLKTQSKLYLRETIKFKKTVVALKPILGKILLDKDTKIFCFCVHSGASDLIYPETSLYKHIL